MRIIGILLALALCIGVAAGGYWFLHQPSEEPSPGMKPPTLPVAATPEAEAAPPRHVILISLDTTRPDYLGCYGHPWAKTPNLDALAKESILFEHCITPAPSTLAAHTSLFTGKYPHTHGTPRNGFTVNADNTMLAEILHNAGYHTAAFLGAMPLSQRFGFNQGFEHYDEHFTVEAGDGTPAYERPANEVTDAVLSYLDNAPNDGKPLFLFIHYFDAHMPYTPPDEFFHMYDTIPSETGKSLADVAGRISELTRGRGEPAEPRLLQRYAGEISFMDNQIGRLLSELTTRGILAQSLLVVVSDHGESLWEHEPYFAHGQTVYDDCINVVGMARLPNGAHGGTRVPGVMSSMDFFPTILQTLALPIPEGIDAEAIDLANASSMESRVRYSEATQPWEEVETDPSWPNATKARCIRQNARKYIETPYAGTSEYYDLAQDPRERLNLLPGPTADQKTELASLKAQLDAWAASAKPLPSAWRTENDADETQSQLENMGYMDSK